MTPIENLSLSSPPVVVRTGAFPRLCPRDPRTHARQWADGRLAVRGSRTRSGLAGWSARRATQVRSHARSALDRGTHAASHATRGEARATEVLGRRRCTTNGLRCTCDELAIGKLAVDDDDCHNETANHFLELQRCVRLSVLNRDSTRSPAPLHSTRPRPSVAESTGGSLDRPTTPAYVNAAQRAFRTILRRRR